MKYKFILGLALMAMIGLVLTGFSFAQQEEGPGVAGERPGKRINEERKPEYYKEMWHKKRLGLPEDATEEQVAAALEKRRRDDMPHHIGLLLLFLLAVIAVFYWLFRGTKWNRETPIQILQRRLAAGEINKKEYKELLKEINGGEENEKKE